MSDFLGLYTAFTGLQAARAGLDTTSHNIANAGTTGFTRQRVDLASRLPAELAFGTVGTGVSIEDISRARRELLDVSYRASVAGESQFTTLAGLLGNAEAALGEPDHGITAAVGSLWGSFEALALDPPDQAARAGVVTQLQALTDRIRSVATAWETAGATTLEELHAAVAETNRLLADVAELNRSILNTQSSPGRANDLLDQRDLRSIGCRSLAGVTASVTESGTARVSIGGLGLVHDIAVSVLSVDPGIGAVTHSSGAAVTAGGRIAGYQTFLTSELPAHRQALDELATELADALNAQHAAGYTPSGAPGGALLAYSPGSAALTLTVAIGSGADVAAAGSAGPPVAPFDGTSVEALAAFARSSQSSLVDFLR
jgi:flagellar hook-associated protein 1 FlgK